MANDIFQQQTPPAPDIFTMGLNQKPRVDFGLALPEAKITDTGLGLNTGRPITPFQEAMSREPQADSLPARIPLQAAEGAPGMSVPDMPVPGTGRQTFTAPSGQGTVTMPAILDDGRSAQDIQTGVEQAQRRAEFEKAGLPTERESIQAQKVSDAKAGIGARAIKKSLDEQGISATREEVAKALNINPDEMTMQDAFRGLNRIQKREQLKRIGDRKEQRINDRLTQRAKRNEDGTPRNDAAVMEDFTNEFATPTGDLEGDKSLGDYLTPSQKREVDRAREKASRGNLNSTQIGRIEKFKEQAQGKAEREVLRKEFNQESEDRQMKIDKALQDATDREEKKAWDKISREHKMLSDEWKRLDEGPVGSGKAKEKREERMKEINTRLDEISQSFQSGVEAGVEVAEGVAEQSGAELKSFNSEEEARGAGFKAGDRVIINGQSGTLT